MKVTRLVYLLPLFLWACNTASTEQPFRNAVTPRQLNDPFQHIVFFWLKEETDANEFERGVIQLMEESQFVKRYHVGRPAMTPRDVVDNSYSLCMIASFASKEEQDSYQTEQVHVDFVEETRELWDRVLVYDSFDF